jgi:hypothetical protein
VGPKLDVLLTSPSTYVNSVTAPLYGLTATGTAFRRVSLDPAQRAGILTLGGFLGSTSHANETSPVMRGKAVLEKLMCRSPPPPPPKIEPLPPLEQSTPTTTRQRFSQHLTDSTCRACHSTFEPMGNAFEGYDPLGAYRIEQNGHPVDTSGALITTTATTPVANALELSGLLAESRDTHQCLSRQVFRFTMGRREAEADRCDVKGAAKALREGQLDLLVLVTSVVRADSFVTRRVAP